MMFETGLLQFCAPFGNPRIIQTSLNLLFLGPNLTLTARPSRFVRLSSSGRIFGQIKQGKL
jgi:hypothetical protein